MPVENEEEIKKNYEKFNPLMQELIDDGYIQVRKSNAWGRPMKSEEEQPSPQEGGK